MSSERFQNLQFKTSLNSLRSSISELRGQAVLLYRSITRARRVDSDRIGSGSTTFGQDELELEVKFNSNLIIKKTIAKIASEMYQARQHRYRSAEKKKFVLPDVNIRKYSKRNQDAGPGSIYHTFKFVRVRKKL